MKIGPLDNEIRLLYPCMVKHILRVGQPNMWVVVYIAPNRKIAVHLKELLEIEGILVKLKDSGFKEKNQDEKNVEVMVSEIEIEEANEVIGNALRRSE